MSLKFHRCASAFAVLLALVLSSSLAAAVDVPKWSVYDIRLTATGTSSNWYTDPKGVVTATLTGPGGVTQTVNGFWDGGNVFDIRFTPTVEGTWTYTTSSRNAGLNNKSGTINAAAPKASNHGFLRIDPKHTNSFVWDDGTRYFMMGQTYYDWLDGAMANDNWKASVDNMPAYGFTKVRFNVYANNVPGEHNDYPDRTPYGGTPASPNRDHLNIAYWQKLDDMIQYMNAKGLVADLIVTTPYGVVGQNNIQFGTNAQNDRFVRYVVNRYAAYDNVIWCMGNEWEKSARMRNYPQKKADYSRLGSIVRNKDPWMTQDSALRPLTIHGLQVWRDPQGLFQFFDQRWPTYATMQYGPRSGYQDVGDNLAIRNNMGHNMPVANDEFKYIGQLSRTDHRNALWSIATAGGYSSTADIRENPNGKGVSESTGDWTVPPGGEYRDVQNLTRFFTTKGIEYWKMTSHNEVKTSGTRVYVLAEPGRQYVVYAAAGGTFTLKLPAGDYYAYRYNPRTGETSPLPNVAGGSRTFTLPDASDWVIHLSTFREEP